MNPCTHRVEVEVVAVQTDLFHSTAWFAPFLVRANEKPGLFKDELNVLSPTHEVRLNTILKSAAATSQTAHFV